MSAGFIPTLSSHGNAKVPKPFHPTWPSTLNRIKIESFNKEPKAIVEQVLSEVGGILGASAPGELPHNELQVPIKKERGKSVEHWHQQLPMSYLPSCSKHIRKTLDISSYEISRQLQSQQ